MRNITLIIFKLLLLTMMVVAAPLSEAASKFVVVIDAGHGGKDHGAIANGLHEKDINLSVAKKVASYLQKNVKGVKVILTRDRDEFITLQKRADIANKAHADLFISIHTNSVDKSNPNRDRVAGASSHVLGPSKDDKNLEVARRENSVIKYEKDYKEKYENFDPDSDESYIIFEMVQKKNVQNSIDLAGLIQTNLYKHAGRRNRGVHQNGFWVLWATSMPSVLIELDFICNPNSAKYLGSSKGQTAMAKGIGEAVKTYIDRTKKTAQATPAPDESSVSPSVNGDYAVLAPATTIDERVVGSAPKPQHTAIPAKRRRRSVAARERSEMRVVETDEIQVATTEEQPVLTAQPGAASQPQPAETSATQQQKTTGNKTKQPRNNREKTASQPAGQTAQPNREVAERKADKPKQSDQSEAKGSTSSEAKPVTVHANANTSGTKTVNVKKPRLNQ